MREAELRSALAPPLQGSTQVLADLSNGEKPSRVGEKLSELTIRKVRAGAGACACTCQLACQRFEGK